MTMMTMKTMVLDIILVEIVSLVVVLHVDGVLPEMATERGTEMAVAVHVTAAVVRHVAGEVTVTLLPLLEMIRREEI